MKKTLISVLMPVYNQEKFLRSAIESILNQTFFDFELLIINDASTDKSLEIISSFKDRRLKFFNNKKRKGLAKSLNFLAKRAKGRYLARMDGDDISEKERLKKQFLFLEKNPKIVLVGLWAKMIDGNGKIIGRIEPPVQYPAIRKTIIKDNPFIHPSVMIRKEVFAVSGGYDKNLFYSQDYDLFLRLVVKYQCVNLPFYLLKFRWRPDFKKQRLQHKAALKIRIKAIQKYGYNKTEVFKLVKPFLFYLAPIKIKAFYWQKKLK